MKPDTPAKPSGRGKSAFLGVVLIALGAGVLAFFHKPMLEFYQGPALMETEHLLLVTDLAQLSTRWVTIPVEKAVETGIEATPASGENPGSRYVLIPVKRSWLVAEVKNGPVPKQLSGQLGVWQAPSERIALSQISTRSKGAKLLPFQLDADYDQSTQCYRLLSVSGVLLFVGVFLIGSSILGGRPRTPKPLPTNAAAHEALAAVAFRAR